MEDAYRPRLPRRARVVLTLLPVAALVPTLAVEPVVVPATAARVLAVLLTIAQAAAFWWLAIEPRVAVAVVLTGSSLLQLCFPPVGPGLAFVALCTFAWLRPARESLWALAATVPLVGWPAAAAGQWYAVALWVGAALLAWSWGALGRAAGARRQAEHRRTALEERARIARELHDVLSHTVSVMVVQAAAADDVFDIDPVKARQAVRDSESAGRQALAELRWFLRTVRSEAGDDGPQPSLADLDRLAETMRQAGLPVTLRRDGEAEVPPSVQLNAYRIVQEALTNSLRHAHAGHASVSVRITTAGVDLEIRDDGRAGARGAAGNGILGMRERAALHGGTLDAGPAAGGGWRVAALLPWRDDA